MAFYPEGAICKAGLGDGHYEVYGVEEADLVVAVRIVFICAEN